MSGARHLPAMVLGIACIALRASAAAADAPMTDGCSAYAQEAATRAALPIDTVLRVMRAESGGNARAVSPKGAMGCMQIMPATWATLTMRYSLGADPFDARRNMIGGALYLAALRTRFGLPGAYAAYNAGPARYARFAADGVALPDETVAYAARLGRVGAPILRADRQARWQEAALFMTRVNAAPPPKDDGARTPVRPANVSAVTDTAEARAPSGTHLPALFPLQSTDDVARP